MFLFETVALIFSLFAVGLVHAAAHLVDRRCPRCHLPFERVLARETVHAGRLEVFVTSEPAPGLHVVGDSDGQSKRETGSREIRRMLQRREALASHRCALCHHAWQTAEVGLFRATEADAARSFASNVRVFPGRLN